MAYLCRLLDLQEIVVAIGTYGAAFGRTHKSVTGINIRRVIDALEFEFVDLLPVAVAVDSIGSFVAAKGDLLFELPKHTELRS
jgi:hypothetical protein